MNRPSYSVLAELAFAYLGSLESSPVTTMVLSELGRVRAVCGQLTSEAILAPEVPLVIVNAARAYLNMARTSPARFPLMTKGEKLELAEALAPYDPLPPPTPDELVAALRALADNAEGEANPQVLDQARALLARVPK